MFKTSYVTFITDDPIYVDMACMMFTSLIRNGGIDLENSDFHIILRADKPELALNLHRYIPNLHIHSVPDSFSELLVANLLAFTKIDYESDVVVYLDSDIIFRGEFFSKVKESLELKTVGASFAKHFPLNKEDWKLASDKLNIPVETYESPAQHSAMYFNTGVIIYASSIPLKMFGDLWISLTKLVLEIFKNRDYVNVKYFAEQIAFTFALKGASIFPHFITSKYHFREDYVTTYNIEKSVSSLLTANVIHYVSAYWRPLHPFIPELRTEEGDSWFATQAREFVFPMLYVNELNKFYEESKLEPIFKKLRIDNRDYSGNEFIERLKNEEIKSSTVKKFKVVENNVEDFNRNSRKYVKNKWQSVKPDKYADIWFSESDNDPRRAHFYSTILENITDETEVVLEVGCGTGNNLFRLADMINDKKILFVGVDISHNMMTYRGPAEVNGHTIVFVASDIEFMPFKVKTDMIISWSVYEYFTPAELYGAMKSTIDATGRVFINYCTHYSTQTEKVVPHTRLLTDSRVFEDNTQIISEHNYQKTFDELKASKRVSKECEMAIHYEDFGADTFTFYTMVKTG